MALELLLVKTPGGILRGADAASQEAIDRFGNGETFSATVKRKRNLGHHNKFFGMLDMAFQNQEAYTNRERFREACLIEAGHCDDVRLLDGTVQKRARSIAFRNCEQTEFEKVYSATVQVLIDFVFGQEATRESLEMELENFLAAFA